MPKKKIANKKRKPNNANKQRQAVNVKIKIDQSRKTNPREPRAVARPSGLPSRAYTANSATPLHTTIMTATPSPAIIQKEPNYSETVGKMFKEAEKRQNNQLQLISEGLAQREREMMRLLDENAKYSLPPTDQLYDALMKEHGSRVPSSFQDPNARVRSNLKTPVRPPPPEEAEGEEESKDPEPVAPATAPATAPAKKKPGRPRDTDEQKALKALIKEEARKQLQFERLKTIANTRANQKAGLASPLAEVEKTPKITKYFKTQKQAEEAERKKQQAGAGAGAGTGAGEEEEEFLIYPKKKKNRSHKKRREKQELVDK